jgi:hypothetical protein
MRISARPGRPVLAIPPREYKPRAVYIYPPQENL